MILCIIPFSDLRLAATWQDKDVYSGTPLSENVDEDFLKFSNDFQMFASFSVP
jgi:hypothetical protein